MSKFFAVMAVVASLPFWLTFLRKPWSLPWYYLFCFLAGELLLLFGAGLLSGLIFSFRSTGTTRCRDCGAPMFSAGRYFNEGTVKPLREDIEVLVCFIVLNAALWITLWRYGWLV